MWFLSGTQMREKGNLVLRETSILSVTGMDVFFYTTCL